MNTFYQWANDWRIPAQAIADLQRRLIPDLTPAVNAQPGLLETAVQSRVRVEASRRGVLLMRNNVGAIHDGKTHIRYGLANDSEAINKKNKSSDLIGVRPVLITPAHVGCTIGQFVARECKREGWTFAGTDREQAQLNFIKAMQSYGADACFASGEGTI